MDDKEERRDSGISKEPSKWHQGEKVLCTGYSLRAPSSDSPQEFYENMENMIDMTTPSRRYPEGYMDLPPRTGTLKSIDKFDNEFFKMNPKQVEKTDIALRLLLEVVQEALMDSKLSIEELNGSKTGVYIGHCFSDYLNRVSHDAEKSGYELVNGAHTMAANRVSYFYNLKGPSLVIDTACSSSMVALHMACNDIRNGVVDRAIVGGISLTLDPSKNAIFHAFNMLSSDGRCYTFDTRANGYCRSEGIVAMILESDRVSKFGICQILGSSVNSDGRKDQGITFPSANDQAENALQAFDQAGVSPDSITYIEAHGTGTIAGDSQELQGLCKVFYPDETKSPRNIPIGSVKSCMGHAEGASGLLAIVKVMLMYEKGHTLPNLNFEKTAHAPLLDGRFKVVLKSESCRLRNACVSNYGFGGTNAFAILGPGNCFFTDVDPVPPSLTFSNDKAHLDDVMCSNQWFLDQIQLGNDVPFKFRLDQKAGRVSSIAFLYSGQGAQWSDMGKKLMETSSTFRSTIQRLSKILKKHCKNIDLERLFIEGGCWMQKELTVLGITSYQIAMTNMLAEVGIVPDYYLGHSLGETAAGYASAGSTQGSIQSEEECMLIALTRSELSSKVRSGAHMLKTSIKYEDYEFIAESQGFNYYYVDPCKHNLQDEETYFDMTGLMAVAGLPSHSIESAIKELNLRETCVACFNSPSGQTISGSKSEVLKLKEYLFQQHPQLFWREIPTDQVAYHAPYLHCYFDFLVNRFKEILGSEERELPQSWLSTSGGSVLNAEYHAKNITGSVYFQQAIEKLPSNCLVVEIGPSSSLLSQVKRIRSDLSLLGLVSNSKPETEPRIGQPKEIATIFWTQGVLPQPSHLTGMTSVNKRNRCHLQHRHMNLWNHTKSHRIFTYKDYEFGLPVDGEVPSDAAIVSYDIHGKDKFLLHHQLNGRALFPATGHLNTLLKVLKLENGIEFLDFEIVQAVVLDISSQDPVVFHVHLQEDRASISFMGDTVSRCRFRYHTELKPRVLETSRPDEIMLETRSIYNHFKRYGYEYQPEFQLIESRTLPGNDSGYAVLKSACHVIPYLDNFLQLFIEDPCMLALPTLIHSVLLHKDVVHECKKGSMVSIKRDTNELITSCVLMRGLHTMPAASASYPSLTHDVQSFVALGHHVLNDNHDTLKLLNQCHGILKQQASIDPKLRASSSTYDFSCHLAQSPSHLDMTLAQKFWTSDESLTSPSSTVLAEMLGIVSNELMTKPVFVFEISRLEASMFDRIEPILGSKLKDYVTNSTQAAPSSSPCLRHSVFTSSKFNLASQTNVIIIHQVLYTQDHVRNVMTQLSEQLENETFVIITQSFKQVLRPFFQHSHKLMNLDHDFDITSESFSQALASTPEFESIISYSNHFMTTSLLRFGPSCHEGEKVVTNWEDINVNEKQLICGLGAHGLLKTLVLETDTANLRSFVNDGSIPNVDVRSLPLRFNTILNGQIGTTVTLPDASAETCEKQASKAKSNYTLHIKKPGDLSSLVWNEKVKDIGDIEVEFSALNFKDVMYGFGKLRLENPSFGLEFSGRNESGELVMGIASSGCISTFAKPSITWLVPKSMTAEEASTIPVVYLTCLYSLFEKARLEQGQTVLIHAGTGGIGHAAIHLCQRRGIEVFTTCAPHKRQYLKQTFGLSEDHIGNTRDTSFVEVVLHGTQGNGVDCVLNSLSGPQLYASLQVVKEYGHFCEIGKYDLQNNTQIGLKILEKNISYHAIDLATMFEHPRMSRILKRLLDEALEAGDIKPLPTHVFDPMQVADALRFLSAGKHRGKVVLKMKDFRPESTMTQSRFTTSGTHVITGGLGGFGLELARWLFQNGADKVIVTSRSGIRNGWQKYRYESLIRANCDIEISNLNAADEHECERLIHQAQTKSKLKGVWHLAMLLNDGLFDTMTQEKWHQVVDIKVKGLSNLDKFSRNVAQDLDAFVAFSSISSLFGNVGQANYSFANNAEENIMMARASKGIRGHAIQWGTIDNVGVLSQGDAQFLGSDFALQNIDSSLESLHHILASPYPVISSYLQATSHPDDDEENFDLSLQTIQNRVCEILGGHCDDYDSSTPLNDYGLDSLSRIELINWMNRHCESHVAPSFLTSTTTIQDVFEFMSSFHQK